MTQGDNNQFKLGDTIGRYKVIEVLGVGGQSVVYRCHDDKLGRDVAVKHITSHMLSDESYRTRMCENIINLARLGEQSDAIVTIHDMFDDDDSGMYYVMEYVNGFSLEFLMQESPEPVEPRAMLLILFRLAAALHDVHKAGIIHRDIKPSNIVVTMEGLRPTIIDFGVAAQAGGEASMPLATTKYLAPEIYDGANEIDGKADLYSLGFLAYEMLLGRDKFNEVFADIVRDKQASALRWMKWHSNMSVKAPALHELLPSVPKRLSNVIAKLMEKDPEKRFATAEDFAKSLRGNFSGKHAPRGKVSGQKAPGAAGGMISRMAQSELEPLDKAGIAVPDFSKHARGQVVDDAPTAPLPKEPMSKGKKIALGAIAGVAVLVIIAMLGFVLWQDHQESQMQMADAKEKYDVSSEYFKAEKFQEALDGFAQLAKQNNYIGEKSQVLVPLCKAHLAIQQGRWDDAQVHEAVAQETINRLQSQTGNDAFVSWLRRRTAAVEDLKKYRYSTNIYRDTIAHTQEAIDKARSKEDFTKALRAFEKDLSISDVNLSKAQQINVARMKDKILLARMMFLYNDFSAKGDTAFNDNDFMRARANYNAALELFTDDPAAGLLGKLKRQSLIDELSSKLAKLRGSQMVANAKAAVEQARETGSANVLKKALKNALTIRTLDAVTADQYKTELLRIELGQEIAKAKKLLDEGDTVAAGNVLKSIKKKWPDNPQANAMLESITKQAKRAKMLSEANTAFTAGEYEKAMDLYKKVYAIEADQEVERRIISCRFNIAIKKAQALMAKGDFEKAKLTYNSAKTIQPSASAQVDAMLVMLVQQQNYANLLAAGDKALRANRFIEAIKMYEEAAKLQATAVVAKRIRLTKYKKNIVQGKEAIDEDDLPRAKFHFKQALSYLNTAEARELYKKVGGVLKE